MSKTYENAPDTVNEQIDDLMNKYHKPLIEAGVTVHALFAISTGGAAAVSAGGYPALACVRIVNLKDRTKGMKDAEITIDAEKFDEMTEPEQLALLDHELHHLMTVASDTAPFKRDAVGRPVLAMRKHDVQIGWFEAIALRHGAAAPEVKQAKQIVEDYRQSFFTFLDD